MSEEFRLGELCEIQDGMRSIFAASASQPEGGSIGFLRFKDLMDTWIQPRDNFVWYAEPRHRLQSGDVILSRIGLTDNDTEWRFRVALAGSEHQGLAFSSDLFRLRVKDIGQIDPAFLAALLASDVMQARLARCTESKRTVARLTQFKLRELLIPLPIAPLHPASYAKKLQATHAPGYQAACDLNTEANALMQTTLAHCEACVAEILAREGESALRPLKELAEVRGSKLKQLNISGPNVSLLQALGLNKTFFSFEQTETVLMSKRPSKARHLVELDQVLLLRSGSNLATPAHGVAVIQPGQEGALASIDFCVMSFQQFPYLHAALLRHPFVRQQIKRELRGDVVLHITQESLLEIQLPVLPLDVAEEIDLQLRKACSMRAEAICNQQQALRKMNNWLQTAYRY